MGKGLKIKLGLYERLLVKGILPQEDSFTNLILRKDLIEKIEITQEEIKKFEIKSVENGAVWNSKGQKDKLELEISSLEGKYLSEVLKKLDSEKKLSFALVDIYEAIVK